MSGISKPGIAHYSMECDHIHNKKIRLLLSEFGADGYWVWSCLVSEGYRTNGYFYNTNDHEELELFANDVCKKQVALVKEVIAGCIRRSLFDKGVFNAFGVLTSVHQQEVYLRATKERRKKGTVVSFREDYLLIAIAPVEVNVHIIPKTKAIPPGKNGKIPRTDTHSKVEYSKVDSKSINSSSNPIDISDLPDAVAPAKPKSFKQWTEKEFGEILKSFTGKHPNERLRAFFDYWREKSASGKMKIQLERTWDTQSRLETWERNESIFGRKQAHGTTQSPNDYLEQRKKDEERLKDKLR